MKKIYNFLFILLAGLSLTACTGEVDDVFDKSSADRIAEAIATDKQLLTAAPNGWLMEYYAADTYGGYNMFVKFNDDNTVTAANELFDAGKRETTHFKLEQSKGVVLSFDEYNSLFHVFSAPSNVFQVGTNGKGYEGDFEFRVIKAEADRFELEGKKHGARIVMTRVADNLDWDSYFEAVSAIDELVSYKKYTIENGQGISLTLSTNYRTFTYHDAETDKDVLIPYIVTDKGLKLNQPIVMGNDSINMLLPGTDDTWKADGIANITITPIQPSLVDQLTDKSMYWSFKKGHMSDLAAKYFAMAENGSAAEGEDIIFMALGVNPNATNLGWCFFFRSGGYIGSHTLTVTPIDDTHISLAIKGYDSNGQYYYKYCGYNYLTNGILRGTFELSTDNQKNPSYIRMTRTDASSVQGEWIDVFPGLDYYTE